MNFSITSLKKHLGPGLGLRKNKYILEMPVPGADGEMMSILCQSAGLPERAVETVELWHKGRKYVVRGESNFMNEYEISIVDDSSMQLRNMFDHWLKTIDNTEVRSVGAASFERGANIATPAYQTDINIWQMSGSGRARADNDSNKVYGYKLQNAYPKSLGIVTLDSEDENALSQFSVTLAFSEFIPLYGDQRVDLPRLGTNQTFS